MQDCVVVAGNIINIMCCNLLPFSGILENIYCAISLQAYKKSLLYDKVANYVNGDFNLSSINWNLPNNMSNHPDHILVNFAVKNGFDQLVDDFTRNNAFLTCY